MGNTRRKMAVYTTAIFNLKGIFCCLGLHRSPNNKKYPYPELTLITKSGAGCPNFAGWPVQAAQPPITLPAPAEEPSRNYSDSTK
jgi:hypothetical protein